MVEKPPQSEMSRVVRVSKRVYDTVKAYSAPLDDTFNDSLERLLKQAGLLVDEDSTNL